MLSQEEHSVFHTRRFTKTENILFKKIIKQEQNHRKPQGFVLRVIYLPSSNTVRLRAVLSSVFYHQLTEDHRYSFVFFSLSSCFEVGAWNFFFSRLLFLFGVSVLFSLRARLSKPRVGVGDAIAHVRNAGLLPQIREGLGAAGGAWARQRGAHLGRLAAADQILFAPVDC